MVKRVNRFFIIIVNTETRTFHSQPVNRCYEIFAASNKRLGRVSARDIFSSRGDRYGNLLRIDDKLR